MVYRWRIWLYGGIGVFALAIIGGYGYANQAPIIRRLDAWMLLPRPERLTELYFGNIAELPAKITPGKPQPVSFAVHNVEARMTEYHYALVAVSLDGKMSRELEKGSFRLEADRTRTTAKAVVIPAFSQRVQVQVRLRYQSIPWGHDMPADEVQQINFGLYR